MMRRSHARENNVISHRKIIGGNGTVILIGRWRREKKAAPRFAAAAGAAAPGMASTGVTRSTRIADSGAPARK